MWVADHVTYTIEITCRRGVDVLADDLSRDKLKTEASRSSAGDTESPIRARRGDGLSGSLRVDDVSH